MESQKYKYNVINSLGKEEQWSGIFESKEEAELWYKKHGKFHEERGHELVLVKCSNNQKD